jgi:hypothetical protein
MKHLFNDIPQSEKQRILEMHGVKTNVINEQYTYSDFINGDVITTKNPRGSETKLKVIRVETNYLMVSAINPKTGAVDTRSYEATIMGNKLSINRGMGSETYIILSKNSGGGKTTPPVAPPKKPTPPTPTVQACTSQVGKAKELFGGSDVNLYREGADPKTEQPIISELCINSIMPLKSNLLKTKASKNIVDMMSGKNGFILFTDKRDETGDNVKLYFECGKNSLVNDNLTNIMVVSQNVATAMGQEPMDLTQGNVTQKNVIEALNKLCSVNPEGQTVPPVQNNKFASTNSKTGEDYV